MSGSQSSAGTGQLPFQVDYVDFEDGPELLSLRSLSSASQAHVLLKQVCDIAQWLMRQSLGQKASIEVALEYDKGNREWFGEDDVAAGHADTCLKQFRRKVMRSFPINRVDTNRKRFAPEHPSDRSQILAWTFRRIVNSDSFEVTDWDPRKHYLCFTDAVSTMLPKSWTYYTDASTDEVETEGTETGRRR